MFPRRNRKYLYSSTRRGIDFRWLRTLYYPMFPLQLHRRLLIFLCHPLTRIQRNWHWYNMLSMYRTNALPLHKSGLCCSCRWNMLLLSHYRFYSRSPFLHAVSSGHPQKGSDATHTRAHSIPGLGSPRSRDLRPTSSHNDTQKLNSHPT